jgi:cystathionine beta-lyase
MITSDDTLCVHPLSNENNPEHAATSPVFPAVAYRYLDEPALRYPGFLSTYNQLRLGEIVAKLEKAKYGMAFCSGMAAITTAILSFLRAGDHIIFSRELYGGTLKFATDDLPLREVQCSFVAPDADSFEGAITARTKIIYIESPSNPLLNIISLANIVSVARKHNIITIIDNTFASPVNQCPVEAGFDICIESGTKYLGGHNDLPYGTFACNNEGHYKAVLATAKLYGGSLAPNECYLAERSLKTLALRVQRQNENAMKLANFLSRHNRIKNVYYPGLPSHPQHAIAAKQMKGFGGMISFETDTDEAGIKKFQQHLRTITPALSLGGVESLVSSPMLTSHRYLSKKERNELGINDNLLRLSVGIEEAEDLINDIEQALQKLV